MESRRDFLKTATVGAAGAAMGCTPAAPANAPGVARIDDPDGVELAIATITQDGFGDEYFRYAFENIPRIGIRNVEFNVWHPRTVTPEGIEYIRERCAALGLNPICLQGTRFGGSGVKDVAHKLWLMEQIRNLGGRRVKFTGGKRGTDGGLKAVINALKQLAPAAEEMDVLVTVENHAENNIETIEDYEAIFDAVPSRHVGMCLDMGHFDASNVDNFEVIDRFHERILHVDLKDTERKGIHKVVNFGSGVTDVHGIIRRLLEHGYTGYLVIEQAPPISRETLIEDMIRAREMFARY